MTDENQTPITDDTAIPAGHETQQQPADTVEDTVTDEATPKADEPFPKKAINKIQRKERQVRQLRAQKRELEGKIAEFEKAKASAAPSKPISPDDYETYGDYLVAIGESKIEKKFVDRDQERSKSELDAEQKFIQTQQQELFVQERDQMFADIPDAKAVFTKALPTLNSLPSAIEELIFELDSPVIALYTLAKEGRLDNLSSMSLPLAAAELVAAQIRGAQTLNSVPAVAGDTQHQIQTPKPMAVARGTGTATGKSLNDMSARELVKWAKK